MSKSNTKGVVLAISSMIAGIACMPVAAFFSTVAGLGLATLSVFFFFFVGFCCRGAVYAVAAALSSTTHSLLFLLLSFVFVLFAFSFTSIEHIACGCIPHLCAVENGRASA